jgi:hypothetical protein
MVFKTPVSHSKGSVEPTTIEERATTEKEVRICHKARIFFFKIQAKVRVVLCYFSLRHRSDTSTSVKFEANKRITHFQA